ncbi:MAG: hypothetical protein K1X74_17260 [Pirellulales bacterium]|nr:hypothetical protein [Pirellulales bacterium]
MQRTKSKRLADFYHEPDEIDPGEPSLARPTWSPWQWAGLLLVGLAVLWGVLQLGRATLAGRRELTVMVSGPQVGRLQPGAAVVLGTANVGWVEQVGLDDGRPVAELKLDPLAASVVRGECQYVVRSLNRFLPGNYGVEIVPGNHPAAAGTPPSAETPVAQTPGGAPPLQGGYLALGLVAFALGLGARVARFAVGALLRSVFLAVTILGLGLFTYGAVPRERLLELRDWALETAAEHGLAIPTLQRPAAIEGPNAES